jgi:hypothetical protein
MKVYTTLFLTLFFNLTLSHSQIITFCIDKFQGFNYPNSFTNVNDALKKDSVKYEKSGKWHVEYILNMHDSLLIYNDITNKEIDTLKIDYYDFTHENNYEIWTRKVMKDTTYRYHYLLTEETGINNMVLILRYVQGNLFRGWFAPEIIDLKIK